MKNIKISIKLIIFFLAIGTALISVIGLFSFNKAKNALNNRTQEQLISIRDIKKSQIETFFSERIGDSKVLADNPTTQASIDEFHEAEEAAKAKGFRGLEMLKFPAYERVLDKYEQTFKYYMDTYGYYDFFVIDLEGDIVYTVEKESDFHTNLTRENTHLADLYKEVLRSGKPGLSDMKKYAPSDDAPAMFVAAPVIHNGKMNGVIALQISNEAINNIMQQKSGLGESGETYLVGEDFLLRSDSRFSKETTVLKQKVETDATKDALDGNENSQIVKDYRGIKVLSSYDDMEVGNQHWAILAEIDEAEVLIPVNNLGRFILIIAGVSLLILVLIAILIARSFSMPLIRGVEFAKTIAAGNIQGSVNINRKDEIGQLIGALNDMAGRLRNVIINIRSSAENIASASDQMSTSSQEMSESSNEQASSTEEVSSTMEEMQANIQQNANNSKQTEEIAQKAARDIQVGGKAVVKTVEAMTIIADKIKIINEIAFQTNILALNAAVEAARAGEEGRGFAVVAGEVKSLADRSRDAAEEIDKVSTNSLNVAENAGKLFSEIVPQIDKTAKLVQDITTSSMEQNSSVNQVTNAVEQLNRVTQQSSAVAEEVASSSEELASQADQLKQIIAFFNVGDIHIQKSKTLQKVNHSTPQLEYNKHISEGYNLNISDNISDNEEFDAY